MIRHIVMFKIKEEYKQEIPQLVQNFYGMKGKIEGMVDLEAGADAMFQLASALDNEKPHLLAEAGLFLQ